MSIGATHTTRPHAFDTVDPRPGPRIIEEGIERAQDVAGHRAALGRGSTELLASAEAQRRRAAQLALQAAVTDFPPMDVFGLLVRRAGLTVELGCSAPDAWHAHHTPVDGDGFPTGDDSHFGNGRTAEEALTACVRQAQEASCDG